MPLNKSISDLHPDLKLVYEEAKAAWKQDYPDGPWPELNETARSKAVQDAYYSRTRQPVAEVQRLYKAAGLYAIDAEEAAKWATNARYGQSAHNAGPDEYSDAFDVLFRLYKAGKPAGVTWEVKHYIAFGGYVLAAAARLLAAGKISIKVVWGYDWNGNGKQDERSYDPPHYELKGWATRARRKKNA